MPPHPFLIALQFLTRVPVRLNRAPDAGELGRSLLWYPLVGVLLGALLCAAAAAFGFMHVPPSLRAALLLLVWILATGALHLDGLADTADAWVGGHGDRERTLAIMKDPHAGPIAVVVLAIVLLVKFAALEALPPASVWPVLPLPPLLARTSMPLLFATTPYLRAGGLGSALAEHLPRRGAYLVVVVAAIAVACTFAAAGVCAVAAAGALFVSLRGLLMRRLGGFTGDCSGAMIEAIEAGVLVALVLSAT
jgi:adenosylcobinamide-GDP ribazoletransferase